MKRQSKLKVDNRSEYTFVQEKYTNGQQWHEKMLKIKEMKIKTTMR